MGWGGTSRKVARVYAASPSPEAAAAAQVKAPKDPLDQSRTKTNMGVLCLAYLCNGQGVGGAGTHERARAVAFLQTPDLHGHTSNLSALAGQQHTPWPERCRQASD